MSGDACEHRRSDLVTVVEGENEVGPAGAAERSVRAGLTLDGPTELQERCQHAACLG
jgi:hypothetical protein